MENLNESALAKDRNIANDATRERFARVAEAAEKFMEAALRGEDERFARVAEAAEKVVDEALSGEDERKGGKTACS